MELSKSMRKFTLTNFMSRAFYHHLSWSHRSSSLGVPVSLLPNHSLTNSLQSIFRFPFGTPSFALMDVQKRSLTGYVWNQRAFWSVLSIQTAQMLEPKCFCAHRSKLRNGKVCELLFLGTANISLFSRFHRADCFISTVYVRSRAMRVQSLGCAR